MTSAGFAVITCPQCRLELTIPIYASAPIGATTIDIDFDHETLHDHAEHCPGNN